MCVRTNCGGGRVVTGQVGGAKKAVANIIFGAIMLNFV